MLATLAAFGASLTVTAPALAAWQQLPGGPSPINESPDRNATNPSLASIGGVPYIAWGENDGTNSEIRVARLSADGSSWEKVANSASPINQSPSHAAQDASLADVGGVPYVAWAESDGPNYEIRVARLSADGTAWDKVANSASPINQSPTRTALGPSLASVDGVPWVAWSETDGTNAEIRVARLSADGSSWEKVGNPASPLNQSPDRNASDPSLIAIAGVPWVAWTENDGVNLEIRVARLSADGTAWEKVANSDSPINESPGANARGPSLASIGGVPHVAWSESDGTNDEIRVARLSADGTAWEKVANSDSPINEAPVRDARGPSLASIGGVPYLAWRETDGTNFEIRVARLSADGSVWEKVANSDSPVNESPGRDAFAPSLASIGGFPYLAWDETDGTNSEIRATRLEPDFLSQTAEAGSGSATLTAVWRTYGLPFPIGFEYGTAFESSTTPQPAPAGPDQATISQPVTGLAPSSSYGYRSFATAGVPAPRVLAGPGTFSTTAPPVADTSPPQTEIVKRPADKLAASRAVYRFSSTEPGSSFECSVDGRRFKPCSSPLTLKRLDPGKHRFQVRATDGAGNPDPTPAKDRFRVI